MTPAGRELMPHQAQVVEAAADGPPHLPARRRAGPRQDRAGAAGRGGRGRVPAARRRARTSSRPTGRARSACGRRTAAATVVHGDGDTVDGFSDVVVVNYEVLDRHVGWLGDVRLPRDGRRRGALHQEQDLAALAARAGALRADPARARSARCSWRSPARRSSTTSRTSSRSGSSSAGSTTRSRAPRSWTRSRTDGLTPVDPGFCPAARAAVIDMGIVRRRKVDVAADIPARRIADLPVELDGALGRSIRDAERVLARRLVKRYRSALAARDVRRRRRGHRPRARAPGRRLGAAGHRRGARPARTSSACCAASARRRRCWPPTTPRSWPATSARSCSSPSTSTSWTPAEETFAQRGIGFASIRGDQTTRARQKQHRRVRPRPGRRRRRLLAHGRRGRAQPAGRLQRRARRAVLDRRRADAGHRPRPPHRPGPAGDGLAHHRRADHRRAHRRAHRQQGRASPPARSTGRTRSCRRRSTCSSRRSSACSPTRCAPRSRRATSATADRQADGPYGRGAGVQPSSGISTHSTG